MLGPHLTLDLYDCNNKKLSDFDYIYKFLDRFPSAIGMHKFSGPLVSIFPGKGFDKGGITGVVLLTESNINIHTFPQANFASVDVFSCKNFDTNKAIKYAREKLESQKIEKNLIIRGKHFPREVKVVEKILKKQRKKAAKFS